MSRRFICGVAVALCFLVMMSSAIEAQVNVELSGGLASPTGDLNKFWNGGPGLAGAVMMEITPFSRGGLSIGYNRMGLDEKKMLGSIGSPQGMSISGGDLSILSICGELRLQAGAMDRAVIFGGAGGGLFIVSLSDLTMSDGNSSIITKYDTENRFGWYINAGVGIPLSPAIKIGAKAQYNFYSVKGEGFPDISDTRDFLLLQTLLIIGI